MKHIIYTYKGKIYQAYKKWSFNHCEDVLKRLGGDYWEIGVPDSELSEILINTN